MAGEAIFIGYRRDDTADVAGRIYDALEARFGRERIFKDVDSIPVGANFRNYIRGILPRCRVALILIGPNWVDARDGSRRLDDPEDLVRIEAETALATPDLQVVPVLVNGAQMPRAEYLPDTLQPILHLNAAIIRRDPDFRIDIDRLAAALRVSMRSGSLDLGAIGSARKPLLTRQTGPLILFAAVAIVALAVATFNTLRWQPTQESEPAQRQSPMVEPAPQDVAPVGADAALPGNSSPLSERVLIGDWKGYWDLNCDELTSSQFPIETLIQVTLEYQGRAATETLTRGDREEGTWSLEGREVRLTFGDRTWSGVGDPFCLSGEMRFTGGQTRPFSIARQ